MSDEWSAQFAMELAAAHMAEMGSRWAHVQAAGRTAEALAVETGRVSRTVVAAAWLHDIGYADAVGSLGFHPVDGARFLAGRCAPKELVSLVAYHSGAAYEADERGLAEELAAFTLPMSVNLDILTLVDMSTGPTGTRVYVEDRLDEIVKRYPPSDPVHRAVSRSRRALIESCDRGMKALGLSDERLLASI